MYIIRNWQLNKIFTSLYELRQKNYKLLIIYLLPLQWRILPHFVKKTKQKNKNQKKNPGTSRGGEGRLPWRLAHYRTATESSLRSHERPAIWRLSRGAGGPGSEPCWHLCSNRGKPSLEEAALLRAPGFSQSELTEHDLIIKTFRSSRFHSNTEQLCEKCLKKGKMKEKVIKEQENIKSC